MQTQLIIISLALATVVVVSVSIQDDPETSATGTAAPRQSTSIAAIEQKTANNPGAHGSATDITELHQLLQNEIKARKNLEQKLETVVRQMAALDSDLQSSQRMISSQQENIDGKLDAPISNRGWFDEQALIEGGMNSSQASELRIYFERLEMERLYLRDQSVRESWSRERLDQAIQALGSREDDLKHRLGESAYDAYLYAAGRPNRVAVTSVLENAPAGMAGILSGDHITRYDNQRIYNWFDLREATTGGNISDTVELEIERDGKTMQFYLVRGPLGIRMSSVSVAP